MFILSHPKITQGIKLSCVGLMLTLSLPGCSIFMQGTPQPADPLTQTCQNLKQDIAMAPTDNALHQDGYSPGKDASLYKEYQAYHCDSVLANTSKR